MLPNGHRGGDTYNASEDYGRLNAQAKKVWDACLDAGWLSLNDISQATGAPPASVSARLRDFRKEKFGAHTVDKRNLGNGLWVYRVTPNGEQPLT